MVRCFVGVFLSEDIKAYILSLQGELRRLGLDCKFVEEQNIHISLSFIGDMDEQKLEEMKTSLGSLGKFQKFLAKTGGVKLVPNEKFTRVIIVDVYGEGLQKLQDAVVNIVGGDVKPPHITLCRTKSSLNRAQVDAVRSLERKEIEFTVDSVDLIKSTITRDGPMYESILKCKLT